MTMRLVVFLALFMLFVSLGYTAFVYGDIYKAHSLEKLNNTVVKIDGRFSYQLVITKSNYSIDLPEVDYTISAEHQDNNDITFSAKEEVRIGEGDQRIDLALSPKGNTFDYVFAAGLVIIGLFLLYNIVMAKKGISQKELTPAKKQELDEDAKKVLQTLESLEGRTTQKELKDTLNFSDAKLSLILSELEQMGKIKKFKRGRGNIIRKL